MHIALASLSFLIHKYLAVISLYTEHRISSKCSFCTVQMHYLILSPFINPTHGEMLGEKEILMPESIRRTHTSPVVFHWCPLYQQAEEKNEEFKARAALPGLSLSNHILNFKKNVRHTENSMVSTQHIGIHLFLCRESIVTISLSPQETGGLNIFGSQAAALRNLIYIGSEG